MNHSIALGVLPKPKRMNPPRKFRNVPVTQVRLDMIQRAIDLVCEHYKLSVSDLFSNTRTRRIALPRQVAVYLASECSGLSYEVVGNHFLMSHTNVGHARRTVENFCEVYPDFRAEIETLKQTILPSGA